MHMKRERASARRGGVAVSAQTPAAYFGEEKFVPTTPTSVSRNECRCCPRPNRPRVKRKKIEEMAQWRGQAGEYVCQGWNAVLCRCAARRTRAVW